MSIREIAEAIEREDQLLELSRAETMKALTSPIEPSADDLREFRDAVRQAATRLRKDMDGTQP